MRLKDCVKLGIGFYFGIMIAHAVNDILGKAIKKSNPDEVDTKSS